MDSIIPTIDIEETATLENYDVAETETSTTENGISFNFDFTTNQFILKDGKIEELTGLEALKVWILKVLHTEKGKYKIYENIDYGVMLEDLIHSSHAYVYVKAELQTEITKALLKNIEILSVSDFTFTRVQRNLTVTFTVKSIYGVSTSEVIY